MISDRPDDHTVNIGQYNRQMSVFGEVQVYRLLTTYNGLYRWMPIINDRPIFTDQRYSPINIRYSPDLGDRIISVRSTRYSTITDIRCISVNIGNKSSTRHSTATVIHRSNPIYANYYPNFNEYWMSIVELTSQLAIHIFFQQSTAVGWISDDG